MFTESSVIPGTVFDFRLWVDMEILTFFVATLPLDSQTKNKV